MGHVRDAMRKFESEEPPREDAAKSDVAAGAEGGPSAVLRAVRQSKREKEGGGGEGGGSGGSGGSGDTGGAGEGGGDGGGEGGGRASGGGSGCGVGGACGRPVAAAVAAGMGGAGAGVSGVSGGSGISGEGGGVAVATARAGGASHAAGNGNGERGFAETAVVQRERGSMISEQYRIMRTNLLAKFEGGRICVMVTSAEANEGKSVTTVNLALALAELQEGRAIIVDCDLRKGRLAKLAGVDQTPGVTEILHGRAVLRDCVRGTGVANLDVLPAGHLEPDEVGELLGRPELAELICGLRRQYEFVLVDTPPVNMVSDVGMIGRCANEALMVVRMNRTSRESVNKAMRLLRAVNVNVAGLALTHQKYFIPGYLYKYS